MGMRSHTQHIQKLRRNGWDYFRRRFSLFALTRKRKIGILVVLDSLLVALACVISYFFMKPYVDVTTKFLMLSMILSIVLYLMFGTIFKVFTRINRYTNLREIMAIF